MTMPGRLGETRAGAVRTYRLARSRHQVRKMQVRVVREGLPPAVQHTEEANLRTQMLRVGGDGAQRLPRCRNRVVHPVWFWNAMTSISAGTVNTTWKYGTSSSSAWRSSSHWARARPWHLGQLRSRHEL